MAEALQPRSPVRLDIQGLRAIAVLAVVADHIFAWPSGGFVGVDIFFVLSGYLITSHLLREYQRDETISIGNFIRSRIRRILPASAVVLAVTVATSYFVLGEARFNTILQDGIFASLLSANWRFSAEGTDYFASGGPVSPLQHFWSLAVEEQFYLVWPLLILAILAVVSATARRHGVRANGLAWVSGVIGAVVVLSLASSLFETITSPTTAYFSTFSRAWELAVGAGLAALLAWRPFMLGPVLSTVLVWVGTVGITAAIFIVPAESGFPAPWAMLPVFATVLVLVGGVGAPTASILHLSTPPMRYVGDISYSLYLWHFPVIVLGAPLITATLGKDSPLSEVLVLVVGFAMAALSYHFVEQPVRHSRWLLPTPGGKRRLPGLVAVAASIAAAALVVTSIVAGSSTVPTQAAVATQLTPLNLEADTDAVRDAIQAEISNALASDSWPADLTPAVADASNENPPGSTAKCGSISPPSAAECTFGSADAPRKAILVGDSIAQAYVPALAQMFGSGEWSLQIMSMYACPYVDIRLGNAANQTEACAQRRAAAAEAIETQKPDLVIISNTFVRGTNPATDKAATRSEWNAAFTSIVQHTAANAPIFVVLPPPAPDIDIQACYSPLTGPADCVSTVTPENWLDMASDQRAVVEENGGYFIDNRYWFCNANGKCPAFVSNTLVKKDQAHPTQAYIEKIAPAILHEFSVLGILSGSPDEQSGS